MLDFMPNNLVSSRGVAGDIGRRIFAKFTPPPPPEDWRGKTIEAVFVGDGLGREINGKVVEDVEEN